MKYDFDSVVDRKGTYSIKWEVEPGELPMWVADMDFKTAPAIIEAMEKDWNMVSMATPMFHRSGMTHILTGGETGII